MISIAFALATFDYRELPQLKTFVKNGSVIWCESRPANYVSICLTLSNRNLPDSAATYGYRHLLEHVISRSNEKLDQQIETVGGTINASTGRDWIQIQWNVPRDQLELGFKGLKAVLEGPNITNDVIQKESIAIGHERMLLTEEEATSITAWNAVYGQNGIDPIGAFDTVSKASVNDLTRIWREISLAENTVVTISGPIDTKETTETTRAIVAKLRTSGKTTKMNRNAEGRYSRTNVLAEVTPPFGTTKWAGSLVGGFAIAALTKDSFLTYTPSQLPGLLIVGSSNEDEKLRKPVLESSEESQYLLGQKYSWAWLKQKNNSPAGATLFNGQILSVAPEMSVRKVYESIGMASLTEFQRVIQSAKEAR